MGDNKSFVVTKSNLSEKVAEFTTNQSVDLYYDNTQRFSTSGIGATVFGQLDTTDLNVSGITTLGSGGSGQAILQKGGTTKLNTENWGVQVNGTLQTYGDGIFVKTNSSDTSTALRLRSTAGDRITIQHVSDESYITSIVGNLNLNAPQVSISTNFSVGGTSTFTGAIDANGDLDVDGHTELDNLNVSGVSTFGNNINASGTSRFEIASMENALVDGEIAHTGDTDTKIVFGNNEIDLQAAGSSRFKVTQFGTYVQSGHPLAFLSASGPSPNIKSGGTNNQDLLFTTGTGNPTRLQVTSAGNVGIGTDNPDQKFHVYGAGNVTSLVEAIAGDAILDLSNTGNANYSGINFTRERSDNTGVVGGSIFMPSNTANNEAFLYIQAQSANAGAGVTSALSVNNGVRLKLHGDDGIFSIETGSKERLRVGAGGSVGIGTESPSAKLDVYDASGLGLISRSATTQLTDVNKALQVRNNSTVNTFSVSYKGEGYFGGSVGIGTTNPGFPLEVYRNNTQTANQLRIEQDGTGDAVMGFALTGTRAYSLGIDNSDSDKFKISTATTLHTNTLFTIDGGSGGSVGIGTANPASLLHIHSGSPRITMSDSGTGAHHRINADSSVGNLAFDVDYDSVTSAPAFVVNVKGAEQARVSAGGSLAVGTSDAMDTLTLADPGAGNVVSLRIVDPTASTYGAHFSFYDTENEVQIGGVSNTTKRAVLRIHRDAPSDVLNISSTGNVGIGTFNQGSKLNVGGDVKISGVVTATSFSGDGSALTGVTAEGSGVAIQNDGSPVGTAQTINFSTNLTASFSGGTATITGSGGGAGVNTTGTSTFNNLEVSGISTFSGNINANGNIVGDTATNISGINSITANSFFGDGSGLTNVGVSTSDINSNRITTGTLNVTGISTFKDNSIIEGSLTVGSAAAITGGAPTDQGNLAVYGSGRNSLIIQTNNNTLDRGIAFRNNGDFYVSHISAVDAGSNTADLVFGVESGKSSPDDISERMRITQHGNVGIGSTSPTAKLDVLGGAKISGVVTATSFQSTVATGTAPFVVASTTLVTNLNADLLDGKSTANSKVGNTIVTRNAAGGFVAGDVTFDNIVGAAATFNGNVSIAGTLTYEDVTNIDSIGIVTARSNIEVGGFIKHLGDTDTMIGYPSDNNIQFKTNNIERLRINNNGVGIGTNSPQTLLHLQSDDPTLRIQRYNQSAYADITADTAGRVTFKSDPGGAASGDGFSFTVNNSEKVRITSSGKIGIGTDDPTSHLQVYRGTAFAGNPIIQARSNNGSTNELKFEIDGDGDAYFNGNVGIGTDDPQDVLHIEDATPSIRLSDTGNSGAYSFFDANAANAIIHADKGNTVSDSRVAFAVDNAEKMRITNQGRIGIGVIDPDRLLHLESNGNSYIRLTDNDITAETDSAVGVIEFETKDTQSAGVSALIGAYHEDTSGNSYLRFDTGNSSTISEKLRITSSGNVGIGSEIPQAQLDVYAGTNVVSTFLKTINAKSLIQFEHNGGPTYNTRFGSATLGSGNVGFLFETGLASGRIDAMVIDRYGKVGIGTNNPQTRLHIRQSTDGNTDGFRISRPNSNASYSQYIDSGSRFNIGYSNPSTADPDPQITLDQNGKVGIGTDLTTTPSSVLTVAPHTTGGRNISLYTRGAVGNKAGIFFNQSPGTGNLAEIQAEYKGTNEGDLIFNTSIVERLRIKSDGKVGIGTDNPARDFHVVGTSRFEQLDVVGFSTFSTGTKFFHHTPRIEMQGSSTATLSFVNATTGTTTSDGMLMGFSSSSVAGFINVLESNHGFVIKTGGSGSGNERINISGVGTVSLRYGTTEEMVNARPNAGVELYFNGTKRLETTNTGSIVTGILTANSFSGDGSALSNLPGVPGISTSGTSTFNNIDVTGIASATAFANFNYLQAPFGSTTTFTVTVASKDATHRYNGTGSSNAYLINGVQSPILTLTPGRTYRFTNDNTGSHPLKFYYEADKTTLYTTGVNFQNTYTEITVSDTTPNVLHYQCTAHAYMGNAVVTNSNVVDTPYDATLRKGLNVTGISTFSGIIDANNDIQAQRIYFGYGTGTKKIEASGTSIQTTVTGSGHIILATNISGGTSGNVKLQKGTDSDLLVAKGIGEVDILGDLNVTGLTSTSNLNVTGISTFANNVKVLDGALTIESVTPELIFNDTTGSPDYKIRKQSGHFMIMETGQTNDSEWRLSIRSGGTIDIPGNLDTHGNLDVDGHTELDNLNVSGIGTIGSGSSGFAELQYQSVKKLETTNSGVTVSGNLLTGHITAAIDGNTAIALQDTGHGFPQSEFKLTNGGRDLNIIAPVDIRLFPQSGENGIVIEGNGAVELYHNNVKKAETSATGITVTGNTTSTGNVIAVDGVFSGNVSVGGTLTYEDVTNVDSVGLITARTGIKVLSGGIDVTGVINSTVAGGNNTLKIETTSSGDPKLNFNAAGSGGHDIEYIRSSNTLNFKQAGGSVRLSINAAGHLMPGADSQYNIGSDTVRFANIYADTLYGDGSNLTNLPGISTSTDASFAQVEWDVVNNGSSSYRFTGPGNDGAEDNPDIYLVRGQKYIFNVNASGHPFLLRVSSGGSNYTDGVTNNGAQSGKVIINVQHDAPAQLFYQCQYHGGMVGNIYIIGGSQIITGITTFQDDVNFTGGKVGIGTNDPINKFEVYGTDAAVTLLNYGQSSGGLVAWPSGRLAFVSAHQNDDLVFGYSNSALQVGNFVERMKIDNGTGTVSIPSTGTLDVDGHTELDNVNVSGVLTATSFSGDGSNLTGVTTTGDVRDITGIATGIGTFISTAGSLTNIDSFAYASTDYKTAEYTVHIMNGSNTQAQKVLVMQNGTTAHSQEYAVMSSSDLLVSIGASISGGNVSLNVNPQSGVSGITTYRWRREVQL